MKFTIKAIRYTNPPDLVRHRKALEIRAKIILRNQEEKSIYHSKGGGT